MITAFDVLNKRKISEALQPFAIAAIISRHLKSLNVHLLHI